MEMSIEMAKQAVESGFSTIIATPHYIRGEVCEDPGKLKEHVRLFNGKLKSLNIDIKILPGNEIYLDAGISGDLSKSKVSTLNGSRYVLIELPFNSVPMDLDHLIFELRISGFFPIIAHPERNRVFSEKPEMLHKYIENGAYAQLNLKSLTGLYGKSVRKTAIGLLKQNQYHFIGTDGHSDRKRSTRCIEELKTLKKLTSDKYYNELTKLNPEVVINDEIIKTATREKIERKHIFSRAINKLFKKVGKNECLVGNIKY
jgi:protein-tyrosine phosphatase